MNGIEAVTSWFTPTIFLCIVTLLITTIFFRNPHRKLLNLIEEEHLPPLYSVLDRVKSFKFSKHRSESRPDPIEHTTTTIEPIREESTHLQYEESDYDNSFKFSKHRSESRPDPTEQAEIEPIREESTHLQYEESDYVKFSKHRSESRPDPIEHAKVEPIREESTHLQYEESVNNHVMRSKSENMENYEAKSRSIARLLKKSFSEKFAAKETLPDEDEVEAHRPATAREKTATAVNGGDEEVDGKADDFINKFRQQLKLQRSDSILRFKEMINRGT